MGSSLSIPNTEFSNSSPVSRPFTNESFGGKVARDRPRHYKNTRTWYDTDIEDDEYYSSLRDKAREQAKARNELYAQSQAAYQRKEGKKAKELSLKGHVHDDRMKEYNHTAAEYMYARRGLHSPGQISKLKPAIIQLVNKYNISCQPDIPNPGCLYIEFGKVPLFLNNKRDTLLSYEKQ
ncbi:hypothetical protein G6F57_000726 [Rhizopus arrhizus]|uniref:DUF1771 domain-containing protein n=1 Tax=Rhizopus oryzae TaxID=64495 RepID=A0A9P7BP82_RHIOR|nr:hypothetical protein G6F22_008423 [Rhizopus arrhizus]KAG1412880.1 hypothetical protein G6F58_007786 [Rhizopus delemar]KAG0786355.1 hypothetical protein G6F21_008649 [Rhizopus arrhizus]KAG0815470.1 hypothetical protein G6F20_003963 [Rhizopus arrhizus]KAG0839514.1 hypothetical protein G6F18_004084 [Rhizopus arrhizus]